jgi:sialate O-acetylesterase
MRRLPLLVPLLGLLAADAAGDVRLPALFSDHLVLQAGQAVPVWGRAEAGEEVTVSFAGQSVATTTGDDGRWRLQLAPLAASAEPRKLEVRGRNRITVDDVLVGEVWLCSGQSNMEMQLKGLHGQVDDADTVIAAASHPRLRMFQHREVYSIYERAEPPDKALDDRPGEWIVCTPQTAAKFIALGYFFGRDLQRELGGTPVGLVHSSIGGTPVEAWTSLEVQQRDPASAPLLADWRKRLGGFDAAREEQAALAARATWAKERDAARAEGRPEPKAPPVFRNLLVSKPGGLYNGMIAPLSPFAVRGVLWYQGERNAAGPFTQEYGRQLELMIRDWRARWADELYFAWVQLPRFQKEQQAPVEPLGWGTFVREGQREALRLPRTGMAITIDLGGAREGHPTNKADYAARLLRVVLHDVYHRDQGPRGGPLLQDVRRDGARMILSFADAPGLHPANGPELRGFAIAGADRKFIWAQARVEGDRVVVWSDAVPAPVAVRYAWAANPVTANLVNAAGLPASPFRTDDWTDLPK